METLKKIKKHDHTLTDIIKAFIFFIVLLGPFLAVLTKCVYVACNKNAYQSYNQQTIYENVDSISSSNKYYLNTSSIPYQTFDSGDVYYDEVSNVLTNDTNLYNLLIGNSNTHFRVFASSSNKVIILYNDANNSQTFSLLSNSLTFQFRLLSYSVSNETDLLTLLFNARSNSLDNVFYYAVDEMKDSELFGWTKETAIYTGVNAMCSGLAVQDGALPVLITYWTLMTAIYIILDIVIFVFKKITHFMQ